MKLFCKKQSPQAGFSLIEVMIALVVLTVGILSLQTMQITAIQGNATAQRLTTGSTWAADRVERLTSLDYNDPLLTDSNNNGVAGLDDTQAGGVVQADRLFTQDAAGNDVVTASGAAVPAIAMPYSVYWNVAVNAPTPNTRTIRIVTVWNDRGQNKTTVMDYVKPNI